MSSYMGRLATSGIEKELRGGMENTIGSFTGMFDRSAPSATNTIDWTNFNYPPFIRIIHYDIKELPSSISSIVRFIHAAFCLAIIALLTNILSTIVLVSGGFRAINLVYAGLNFVIVVPYAGYTFYQGYKALAVTSPRYINRYLICQGIMASVCLFFSLSALGCTNGWCRFASLQTTLDKYHISDGMHGFWFVTIIIESTIWTVSLIVGMFGFWKSWKFNPFHSQEARPMA